MNSDKKEAFGEMKTQISRRVFRPRMVTILILSLILTACSGENYKAELQQILSSNEENYPCYGLLVLQLAVSNQKPNSDREISLKEMRDFIDGIIGLNQKYQPEKEFEKDLIRLSKSLNSDKSNWWEEIETTGKKWCNLFQPDTPTPKPTKTQNSSIEGKECATPDERRTFEGTTYQCVGHGAFYWQKIENWSSSQSTQTTGEKLRAATGLYFEANNKPISSLTNLPLLGRWESWLAPDSKCFVVEFERGDDASMTAEQWKFMYLDARILFVENQNWVVYDASVSGNCSNGIRQRFGGNF